MHPGREVGRNRGVNPALTLTLVASIVCAATVGLYGARLAAHADEIRDFVPKVLGAVFVAAELEEHGYEHPRPGPSSSMACSSPPRLP